MDERYARQIIVPEIGSEGQQKIHAARVLVIGAGGLGCPVIQYLAAAGTGCLGIMDFDVIEESNLPRQPLFSEEDIGKPKALVAAQKSAILNPHIKLHIHAEKLTSANASTLIAEYDLVVDCTDNFTARYIVNDACVQMYKPWVFAAIEGWSGQVSVFNYKGGPVYRDFFPDAPEDFENCNTIGVIATLPGIIGTIQANEALKCILGADGILSDRMLIYDLLKQDITFIHISKKPAPSVTIPIDVDWQEINPDEYTILDIRPEGDIAVPGIFEQKAYYDISTLDFKTGRKYLLVCESGKKSRIIAEKLRRENSLLQVFSLKGGIEALAG